MPINVICDYYIYKTDLVDLSSFKKKGKLSRQILKNVFPDREFLWSFSLFFLCSGYPGNLMHSPVVVAAYSKWRDLDEGTPVYGWGGDDLSQYLTPR